MYLVKLTHPNRRKANHSGRAKVNVVTKWLVLVNKYGNNPIKLLKAKKIKSLRINIEPPEFRVLWLRRVFTSPCKVVFKTLSNVLSGLGITHIEENRITRNGVLNQLGNKEIDEEGSKMEKRLFIIFKVVSCWIEGKRLL